MLSSALGVPFPDDHLEPTGGTGGRKDRNRRYVPQLAFYSGTVGTVWEPGRGVRERISNRLFVTNRRVNAPGVRAGGPGLLQTCYDPSRPPELWSRLMVAVATDHSAPLRVKQEFDHLVGLPNVWESRRRPSLGRSLGSLEALGESFFPPFARFGAADARPGLGPWHDGLRDRIFAVPSGSQNAHSPGSRVEFRVPRSCSWAVIEQSTVLRELSQNRGCISTSLVWNQPSECHPMSVE